MNVSKTCRETRLPFNQKTNIYLKKNVAVAVLYCILYIAAMRVLNVSVFSLTFCTDGFQPAKGKPPERLPVQQTVVQALFLD